MRYFYFILMLFVNSLFFIGTDSKNLSDKDFERVNEHIIDVKQIADGDSRFNKSIAFMIDMRIKSGKFRFFVYNMEKNIIIDQGLVAHGSGSETSIRGDLKFSNVENSNCTSLGRYSVEKSYYGIFGKSYRLIGLDSTNNNALRRGIVLHAYSAVPGEEQDYYISNSHGCPMVNENFFRRLQKIIDSSRQKILLDIYY